MKNSTPSRALVALAAAIALAGLTACQEHHTDVVRAPAAASPSAVLIGTTPAPPTGDPPGTTPVTANTTEVTKLAETQLKPSEGKTEANPTGISPEGAAVGNAAEKKDQKIEVKVAQ